MLRHRRLLSPRSTPRSTRRRCGRWPGPGREVPHEPRCARRLPITWRSAGRWATSWPARRSCSPSSSPTLRGRGAATVTTEHALAWAMLPGGDPTWHAYRLSAVRGFATYLPRLDPGGAGAAAQPDSRRGQLRATPYLYSDAEITALISAAASAAVPAAGRDLPDADRPAGGHRDAGRRGDRPGPRRPRPARPGC